MCGWAGLFGSPVATAELAAAGDLLASRGPDGAGERLLTGPLRGGLTHRRLAIIDTSDAGAQPMHLEDRCVSVAYNGEIYNSPVLRRELEATGVRFRSTSDTEVLLAGWAEWGDAVLDRIEGIFSFALVDERAGRVLLARDRTGTKPLYWGRVGDTLVAGSAPRALLALRSELGDARDDVALAQFLTLLWIPHPRTPWRRIAKLPPATALSFDGRELRTWRYWDPPAAGERALDPGALRATLTGATTSQLLADVPVGILFSGGLDSTILLELVADRHGADDPLPAVTAGYDSSAQRLELVPDDTAYARRRAQGDARIALAEVEVGGDPEAGLDALAFHFDDPVADPAAITLWQLCRATDTKVLLSGVGGEELFAGYPRHGALATSRRLAGMPRPVRRAGGALAPALLGGRPGPAYGTRRNAQKLLRSLGEASTPHYWRMMAQLRFDELDRLVPGAAVAAFAELDDQTVPIAEASLADALAFDRSQFLPNLNLAYVDKASMATGVEVRVPLLDESMLDLTLAASPASMIVDGTTKAPLKAAARGLVPDAIIDRPKTGFGGPARHWFRGPGSERLHERVLAAADAGLVRRDEAERIYRGVAAGTWDGAMAAWALVCLAAWYDEHGSARATARGTRA